MLCICLPYSYEPYVWNIGVSYIHVIHKFNLSLLSLFSAIKKFYITDGESLFLESHVVILVVNQCGVIFNIFNF